MAFMNCSTFADFISVRIFPCFFGLLVRGSHSLPVCLYQYDVFSVYSCNARPLFILRMSCRPLAILGQTLKIFFYSYVFYVFCRHLEIFSHLMINQNQKDITTELCVMSRFN